MSEKVELPSPRSFGLTFAVVFAIIGLWPLPWRGEEPRYWSLGIAAAFAIAPFVAPRVLAPFNWLWFQIGLALHHIVNPLLMALIYYLAVVPIGLLLRLFGKDLLRLRRRPKAASYWIAREPPGPEPGSMTRQF
jgi:MFS family permease